MSVGDGEAVELVRAFHGELVALGARMVEAAHGMSDEQRHASALDMVAAALAVAAVDLDAAVADLGRRAARPPRACSSATGGCPVHGDTLEAATGDQAADGVRARCRRCGRTWKYHRWGEACDQVATHRAFQPAREESGEQPAALVCRAHARQLIEWGWSVRTDPGAPEASAVADADLAAACRRAARRRSVITAATVLLAGLGYAVRESSETPDDEHGWVTLTMTGPASAAASFVHDPAADVYVWDSGWSASVSIGSTLAPSWPALVEALAVAAGAELPPVVLAARMADGGVEALAEDLAADLRPLIEYGYLPRLEGDPDTEVTVTLTGYGRRYGALFRAVDGPMIVFAGGWAELGEPHLTDGRWVVDGLDDDGPVTWSAWPAFLATLRDRAEAEGFGA